MNLLGLVAFFSSLALLLLYRRPAEHDRAGNPALLLRAPGFALLPWGCFLLWEALSYRYSTSFERSQFAFYALLFLAVCALVAAALLLSYRVTVEPRQVVLRIPLFWRRAVPLSQLVEIQDDSLVPIVVFTYSRKITILPFYSGVAGFLHHLRAHHAELQSSASEA